MEHEIDNQTNQHAYTFTYLHKSIMRTKIKRKIMTNQRNENGVKSQTLNFSKKKSTRLPLKLSLDQKSYELWVCPHTHTHIWVQDERVSRKLVTAFSNFNDEGKSNIHFCSHLIKNQRSPNFGTFINLPFLIPIQFCSLLRISFQIHISWRMLSIFIRFC